MAAGTGTSPSPCSPTPSSVSSAQKRGPTSRLRPAGKALTARNQAPHHTDRLAPGIRPPPRDPLLPLATKTSTPRPAIPLQSPQSHPTNATVVLGADEALGEVSLDLVE